MKAKDHMRANIQFCEYLVEMAFTMFSKKEIKNMYELFEQGISPKEVLKRAKGGFK